MIDHHVVSALREKRMELSSSVIRLEQHLARHRADLAHLDAAMKLFLPENVAPIVSSQQGR